MLYTEDSPARRTPSVLPDVSRPKRGPATSFDGVLSLSSDNIREGRLWKNELTVCLAFLVLLEPRRKGLDVPSDVAGRSRPDTVDEDEGLAASEGAKAFNVGEPGGVLGGEAVIGVFSEDKICGGGGSMPVANLQKVAIAR